MKKIYLILRVLSLLICLTVVIAGQLFSASLVFCKNANGDWSPLQLITFVLDAVFIVIIIRKIKGKSRFYVVLLQSMILSALLFVASIFIVKISDSILDRLIMNKKYMKELRELSTDPGRQ